MNGYEAKVEARRQRLEARAARLQAESNARYNSGMERLRAIPFGQPILVGHHSERRDRNYRRKAIASVDRAFELHDQAQEVAGRAAAVGTGGISGDDPEAVAKLRAKLAKREAAQARMKAANAAIRKHRKAGPEAQFAALVEAGIPKEGAAELLKPDFAGRVGFADYQLTNNNAEIRRTRQRLAQLEAQAARLAEAEAADAVEVKQTVAGVEVVENLEANRLQLIFPGKPAVEISAALKSAGFRWAPSAGAWQRQLNNGARYAAERVLKSMEDRS